MSSSPERKRCSHCLGIFIELVCACRPLLGAQLLGRPLVDSVLGEVPIDLLDHDAVVERRSPDGDVAVLDVFQHRLRIALERVSQAAAAGARALEGVPLHDRNTGEVRAQELFPLGTGVEPHAVGDRREAAADAPGHAAGTVTAVGHDRALDLGEGAALAHADAPAMLSGATGVGHDLMGGGQHAA